METDSLESFIASARAQYTRAINEHLEAVRQMLSPFAWSGAKTIVERMAEEHQNILFTHQEGLLRLLEVEGDTRLEFIDAKFTDLEEIERQSQNLADKQKELVAGFLKKQRILNTVTTAEFEEIKRAANEIVDFTAAQNPSDAVADHKIISLRYNPENQTFYAFTSGDKVALFSAALALKETVKHTFGSVTAVDNIGGAFVVANAEGNVFFAEGPQLAQTSAHHFSLYPKKTSRGDIPQVAGRSVRKLRETPTGVFQPQKVPRLEARLLRLQNGSLLAGPQPRLHPPLREIPQRRSL